MMPHEVTELIAKVLFVVSAATVLCMARVRAEEIKPQYISQPNAQFLLDK